LLEGAVTLSKEINQMELQALYQYNLGLAYKDSSQLDKSVQCLDIAAFLQSKLVDKYKLAVYTNALGVSLSQKGSYDKAREKYQTSLDLVNKLGDTSLKAFILCNIGELLRISGAKEYSY
jgi:tetratricopeptide (TPR) repeat protein